MTDHANELRRHARKIPHPQGETPGVMLRAADEIECLRAKIEQMEQQGPSEQDASVRKAWARFSHELHRSPDAPYPGMADAFEQHFSQSFIDREWRAEAATWAAAWKAAKRHGAQPAPSAPSEEAAAEMGANGGHVVEAERLAFEAWMRGHCWELGAKWTGTEYRSAFEKGGMVDMHAMRTRELWAAWRDRAALAAAPEAKPCP